LPTFDCQRGALERCNTGRLLSSRFAVTLEEMKNGNVHRTEYGNQERRVDGRLERSRSSRARIVAAMLDLVGSGDVNPSAARVAEQAQVGLRSVFRHFADMDALYREMGEVIEARVGPIIAEAPVGATWKQRLFNIAERRAKVFETILPFRISANLKRFQSPYLMQDYRRMLSLEIAAVDAQLPESVRRDATASTGLSVILSFQTWRLLRHDQQLPVEQAQAVVYRLLQGALADLPEN
jgi:AcrR family transcriptional regulator